ncbi:hypothetical protein BDP27DRAFT_38333 [Rhodocollybia butyracea]|uniref:E3 ubiquitin-protein ligase listerin n=1 Tax=Rhodocollybia butyracea TaxID=206335 RepID=A0A9P5PZA3_9AGAR|nr:hypothetical protein BDP27DRAFT_38333 [Rhodocollybia butyracea]
MVKKSGPSTQSTSKSLVSVTASRAKSDGPPKKTAKKRKDGGTKKPKLSKKEAKELEKQQRQKAYVAPRKPQPVKPDPLDSTGLAYVLPPQLTIVLRNLGKKAVKTRERALDELVSGWLDEKGEEQEKILVDMLPVWLSHLPQLLLHPSRRIRLTAANVHRALVNIPVVLEQIKLQDPTSESEAADVLGIWALATHDIDPAVASVVAESWQKFVGSSPSTQQNTCIISYAQRAILDAGELFLYLNPAPPAQLPTSAPYPARGKQPGNQKGLANQKGGKGKQAPANNKGKVAQQIKTDNIFEPKLDVDDVHIDSLETDTDRDARIRVGALGALAWVLSNTSEMSEMLDILTDPRLWSSLTGRDSESFGFEQPPVRKAAWRLVGAVAGAFKSSVSSSVIPEGKLKLLRLLSASVLHSAWQEYDVGVQGVLWQPLLQFLRDNGEVWKWEMEYTSSLPSIATVRDSDSEASDSDSEAGESSSDDERKEIVEASTPTHAEFPPSPSSAYEAFLSFLARGCNGSPVQAYPAVVIVLSTIPLSILLPPFSLSSESTIPFANLFSAFWAVMESGSPADSSDNFPNHSRIFAGVRASKASQAFIEAVLECTVFLIRRVVSQSQRGELEITGSNLDIFVRTQMESVWANCVGVGIRRKLQVPPHVLGSAFGRALRGLRSFQEAGGSLFPSRNVHDEASETIARLARESATAVTKDSTDLAPLISGVLKALGSEPDAAVPIHSLIVDVFGIALDGCEHVLGLNQGENGSLVLLTELLSSFGFSFGSNPTSSEGTENLDRIDTLVVQNALRLLLFPKVHGVNGKQVNQGGEKEGHLLLVTYLLHRDPSQAYLLWLALLEQVVEHSHQNNDFIITLRHLLGLLHSLKSQGGREVLSALRPATKELDDMLFKLAEETISSPASALSSSSAGLTLLRQVLLLSNDLTTSDEELPHPLLTTPGLLQLVEMLIERFGRVTDRLLGIEAEDDEKVNVIDLVDQLDHLLVLMEVLLELPLSLSSFTDKIFLLAHVLPRCFLPTGVDESTDPDIVSSRVDTVRAKALRIWVSWVKTYTVINPDDELISNVYSTISQKLRRLLACTTPRCRCRPEDVVGAFHMMQDSFESLKSRLNPIDALLPSQMALDASLDGLHGAPINRSLGVVDELAGVASLFKSSQSSSDSSNVQIYLRYVLALLRILGDDLRLARRLLIERQGQNERNSWWVLRHLLALSVYTDGETMVPNTNTEDGSIRSSLFITTQHCREVAGKVHQVLAYVFASAESNGDGREWRKEICAMLLKGLRSTNNPNSHSIAFPPLADFLVSTINSAIKTDSYRDCRVLREVLSRAFQSSLGGVVSEEEGTLWLQYARSISEPGKSASAPLTSITILSTLITNLPASSPSFPRLDLYRNELASSLLGIPPSRSTSDGLRGLLKLVLGTAPGAESEVEFLPVQRAMNVIKTCQKWIEEGGDEDEEDENGDDMEELESAMTLTFFHLAPILQNVPGGHWQFIFDVVENNMENCAIKLNTAESSISYSPLQLLTLARTLRLISYILDLAATNKSLRAEWNERRNGIMNSVRDMLILDDNLEVEKEQEEKEESKLGTPRGYLGSLPASVCRELVLELVANHLPDELVDHETLPKMCHLLSSDFSSSISTQTLPSSVLLIHNHQLSYQLLRKSAKKRTEYFVLEAGVDTEGKVQSHLPMELMKLLQQSVNVDLDFYDANLDAYREQNILVYLLGWMILFDLFEDTSMKVRMKYIEQLRSSGIIEAHFIPSVFGLLRLDRGIVNAFKLDMWAVNEFYVQFFEWDSISGLQTLAAHLYYRALLTVPSLMYSWVLDCRDRQLSSTIATYTSAYFSPVLIRTELDHVKSPEAQSELASDDPENQLTVKIASGAVNEVTASYLVDEQQLEIRLRIPGDWPLHRIEIRDTKKFGVDDNRWRAWILAVQQTIWSQNGRIVDGLALFKKNVTGHFAGQVECAICYSLISVMDGSLPKKPCNTCKNRFHAGCLFKWFNSSHSSSCPLCRSDILH